MLKILSKILQEQFQGDIASVFNTTPKFAINNYIKDLTQIGYLFVIFTLSLIIFLSSFIKKSTIVGFTTLFTNLSLSFLINIKSIGRFMPNKLIVYANNFTLEDSAITVVTTLLLSLVLILLAIQRMHRVEVI